MLEITVAELQSNLDHYLGLVQKGEEVVVSNEGQAIARIQAIPAVPARYTEQERKLVVEGKLIPAKEPMTKEFIEQLSERLRQMEYVPGLGEAARQAIIDDRREGL